MNHNLTIMHKGFVFMLLLTFLITQSFAQCPTLFNTTATTNVACSGDQVTFTAILNPTDAQNGSLSVELGSGNVLLPTLTGPNPSGLYSGSLTLDNTGCYPETQSFTIRLTCDDDGTTSAIQTEDITVYPSNVEEFITIEGDDCSVSVGISEDCINEGGEVFLNVEPDGYTAEPGESGTWAINYNFIDKLGFNPCPDGSLSGTIEYPYNCFDPCGNFAGEMGGSTFVCGNLGFIVSPIDNGAIVDPGSTLVFVIHDGTSAQIGPNVYAVVGPGEPIMNDGTIPTNVSLCFSAVVGDQLDANGIPQPDGCYDISDDCQPVIFLDPITINATEICDPETGQYDVQVMINGGGPGFFPGHTYEVTGALSGEVLASEFTTFGPFNSGDTYSFEVVEDGKGCNVSYEGTTMCDIDPDCDAGVLGGNAFVCEGEFVVASTIGAVYPSNSTLNYVLHDGDSDALGDNIYATSVDGRFTNDGTIPTNVTLCITAVVSDGADACYDISNCYQAVFLDPITVETTEICDDETGQYTVEVNISGGGPEFFVGHTYVLTGDFEGEVSIGETNVLGPFDSNYTYSFNVTNDGKNCSLDGAIEGTADCGIYDLALTKTVASPAPYTPGSDVLFTIQVINQGNIDANNVEITDYIPAGMSLSTNDNNGWTASGSNATTTVSSIAAGSTEILSILLTIDAAQGEGSLVNYAEISGDDGDDIDSNTDQDISNDVGGVPNSATDNSTNGVKGEDDEDDHDPAQIDVTIPAVYDLALIKTVASSGPFMPGDDVTFTIEVINQGGVDANNVEVTDYIPSGMTLSSADTNGWTVSGSNATATITSIAAGSSATIDIILTIDAGQDAGPIVNYAEISGDDGDDADSNTDQDAGNDAGGQPNTSTDNSTDGSKGGDDEDDHDPAQIDVTIPAVYDLALIKTVASSGPFMPGDDVTFTIEVINQGDVDANNVEVTDYIPSGMTLSSADTNGWTVSGSNATATISSIAAGTSATIDIILTIDAGQDAGPIVNYAEISGDDGDDADSNTDQDAGNDAGGQPNTSTDDSTDGTKGGDDEDDHDPAQIDVVIPEVYDLALIKTVASSGPFMPGDDVTFTIEVINQGGVDANNVEVTDYIPSGMTLSSADTNGWTVSGSNATATISSIAAGTSATIDIILTIDAGQDAGPIVNYAEISGDDGDDADSNTDQDAGNDAGGQPNTSTDDSTDGTKGGDDEDDHDPAQIDVTVPAIYDLALIKTVDASQPYAPGSDVVFTIEVINQGDVDAANVEITDYIPAGLSLSSNDNNGWIVNGSLATVTISSVPVGGSQSVDIVLTIDADLPDGAIVNYAEISGDDGDDIDSNTDQDVANDAGGQPNTSTDNSTDGTKGGDDEDDHDPAQIDVMTAILAGCTDPCAPNYDATAEANDGSCEPYNTDCNQDCTLGDLEVWDASSCSCIISLPTVLGCMDMDACNFDTNANCEDNSLCDFGNQDCSDPCNPVSGCTDSAACNYNPDACVDDDSCDLGDPTCTTNPCNPTRGCTDSAACNYDPDACVEDGSCQLGNVICADPCNPVPGCTNPDACNYNPDACEDDGSCQSGDPTCTTNPCNPTPGCVNPAACNYDPDACVDDGSCDFGDSACPASPCNPVPGCTDPDACNYNPEACVDNGTCQDPPVCNTDPCAGDVTTPSVEDCSCVTIEPQVIGCTDPAACNYNAAANCDDDSCEPCEIFDLALIKDISPNIIAMNMDIYCPGDEVRFSIAVYNQGDISAFDIEITDYIPEGMSLSDNSANDIWTVNDAGTMAVSIIPFIEANGGVGSLSIFLTIDEDYTGATLENYAEISGDNGDDHDSNADNILGNDAGGVPNTPADNDVNGVKGGFDEDDHDGDIIYLCDPEAVHDLALTKVRTGPGTPVYCPGDDVMFVITVTNQGNVSAYNTEIIDYIPSGFTLSTNDVNGWTSDGSIAMNIITFLDAGQSVNVPIILTVGADVPGGTVINYAEISSSDGDDVDSTPDTDPNNDEEAEDDHDSEEITIVEDCDDPEGFDLALIKQVAEGQTGPFNSGSLVTFTITVFNQGTVTATNVGIIDYAPTTLILNDADWTALPNNQASTVIPGPIEPGATSSVDITFMVDPELFHSKEIVNYAEIQFATDGEGNQVTDIDSNFDSSVGNDAGGAPGTPADDYIDGDGTGGQGDGVAATDEDDADPAIISVVAQACSAGVLPPYLYSCADGIISVSPSGAFVPGGYEFIYILHNGDEENFGDIIEINTTGVFNVSGYPTNTPLTVQTMVGPPKPVPSDLPVLCDLSNAATLVFLDPIEIEADYTCDPSTEEYTVTFTITGGLPGFDASQTYTVTGDYSSNVTANTPITFGPISDTSYEIYVSDPGGCTGTETELVECVKLPITLISYDGSAKEDGNLLKWITGSETDNEYFTLEVSTDGSQFETIATIQGAGNSIVNNKYDFLHRTASAGLSYYRLSQTDFDGTTVKVGTVEVVRGESALGIISLTPVPVLENLHLSFTSSANVLAQVEVLDAIGRSVIVLDNLNQATGIHNVEIDVSNLTSGVYFVRLKADGNVISQKFIKE